MLWSSPGRSYHDVTHLDAVLALFDALEAEDAWDDPASVYVALLYHDAVYVPGRSDNEAQSAALARADIARLGLDVDAERVAWLILLTARHGDLHGADADAELDDDARLFLDCDLAVLGGSAEAFARYEAGIRAEFEPLVGEPAYRAGRRAFLERLAASPRLFFSDRFRATHEAAARANLAEALGR